MLSLPKKNRKPAAIVGLEIEPSHIAAVVVNGPDDTRVGQAAVTMLPPGVMRDGEIADPAALTELLRSFFIEHDLPTSVRVGLASQRVVVRTIEVAPLDGPLLEAAIRAEAPDHIPMPMGEAAFDFVTLGRLSTPQGERERVVIVAVRRDTIQAISDVVAAAGLTLVGVDLSAFAMLRSLEVPFDPSVTSMIVNAGGLTNVAVATGSDCVFTRATPGGVDAIARTLADRASLTIEHARQWLGHVGLEADIDEIAGDPEIIATTRSVLQEGSENVADAVRNSLNFFRSQAGGGDVQRLIVAGPGAAIPGFTAHLQARLDLPAVTGRVHATSLADGVDADRLTVATGLAVTERPAG